MPRQFFLLRSAGIVFSLLLLLLAPGCDSSGNEEEADLEVTDLVLTLVPQNFGNPIMATFDVAAGEGEMLELLPGVVYAGTLELRNASAADPGNPTETVERNPEIYQLIYEPAGNVVGALRVDAADKESEYLPQQEGDDNPVGLRTFVSVSDGVTATAQGALRIRLSRYAEGSKVPGGLGQETLMDVTWPVIIPFL